MLLKNANNIQYMPCDDGKYFSKVCPFKTNQKGRLYLPSKFFLISVEEYEFCYVCREARTDRASANLCTSVSDWHSFS